MKNVGTIKTSTEKVFRTSGLLGNFETLLQKIQTSQIQIIYSDAQVYHAEAIEPIFASTVRFSVVCCYNFVKLRLSKLFICAQFAEDSRIRLGTYCCVYVTPIRLHLF